MELGDPLLCAPRRARLSPAEDLVTLLLGAAIGGAWGVLGQPGGSWGGCLGAGWGRGAGGLPPASVLCAGTLALRHPLQSGSRFPDCPKFKGQPLKAPHRPWAASSGASERGSEERSTRCRAEVLPPNSSGFWGGIVASPGPGGDVWVPCGGDLQEVVAGGPGGAPHLPLATRGLSAAGGEGAVPLGACRGRAGRG